MSKIKPTFVDSAMATLQNNITTAGTHRGCRTDQEFADKLGMKRDCYNRRRRNPRLWTFPEIAMAASAFGVSLAWLVTDHCAEMRGGE